jgi:sugar-specific transcriptional regulator TrmB
MIEKLKEAGLTENESKIYLALLEIGPANAGLISRKSGLHRRVVYDSLDMLVQKGVVGYIKRNNTRLFQAANPERVRELLEEKEKILDEIMPKMMELYSKSKEKEETNFFVGINGLKTIFEDQINTGKEILILGASNLAYEILEFYFHWFDKRRKEHKIKTRIIAHEKIKSNLPLSEIRYLPKKYHSPLAVNIYGKKVALILWDREKPLAILINNEKISNGYKNYFEILWKIARK